MSCKWPTVRLGDHIDSCLGKMLDQKKNKGTFHKYLGNSHVRWGVFDLKDLPEMRFEDAEHDRYSLKKGDLVICEGGEPGRSAIWECDESIKIQKALHRVRPHYSLNNYYLFYWLLDASKSSKLEPYFTGTTIKHLTGKALASLPIELPPIDIQKNIAKVLKSLDDNIHLNTQTNQTLEEMAQAIFKSWFVDFDPVKAKMNGQQPVGMDDATAALFPDKLVDSELGLIPEGWDVGTLGDVAQYCSSRISIEDVSLENYISTENMLAEKNGVTTASKLPTAKMIAEYKTGDILVSNIRPYFKKIWLAEGNGGRSNDVLGFEPKAANTSLFLMNLLYQDSFFEYMTRTAKGAKMPRGDKTSIMNWEMPISSVELREAFSTIVDKFYKLINQNRAQNESLEALRDTLLPKLLSGEIELDQAQDLTEVSP